MKGKNKLCALHILYMILQTKMAANKISGHTTQNIGYQSYFSIY